MSDPWDTAFGRFQGRKVVSGRPETTRNRWECDLCGEIHLSDEALQLHKLYHAQIAQTEVLRQFLDLIVRERK